MSLANIGLRSDTLAMPKCTLVIVRCGQSSLEETFVAKLNQGKGKQEQRAKTNSCFPFFVSRFSDI
jgi:hypothetical protein